MITRLRTKRRRISIYVESERGGASNARGQRKTNREMASSRGGNRLKFYFLYKKIASAISKTVMIHRMRSLLRFFPSAILGVQHTSNPASSIVLISYKT